MNPKHYIDTFSEIAELDKAQQFTLLEQARYEAFAKRPMAVKSVLLLIMPMLCIALLAGLGYYFFGYSSLLPLLAIVIGLVVSRLIVSHYERKWLYQGLITVLAKRPPNA